MLYNVQVIKLTRDYRKAKTLRGRKDTLAPVFLWGALPPYSASPRIDAIATDNYDRYYDSG